MPLLSMTTHCGGAHLLPSGIMHASPGDFLCNCLCVPECGNKLRHRDIQESNGDGFFSPLVTCFFLENNSKYESKELKSSQVDDSIYIVYMFYFDIA